MQFNNEVVLITGSSRGLGKAFAECLANEGAHVVINDTGRNTVGADLAAQLQSAGQRATYVGGQVEDASTLVEQVIGTCGRLDAVVHNAGFVRDKTLRKMTLEQWHEVMNVHLTTAFTLTQAAWAHFEAVGSGRLVFVSSASGLYGNFGQANYAAAKAGMYGLCRTIAIEGAKADIRCNCVAPFGATTMNNANMDDAMKNTVKAEFIAPLIAYLAHPQCLETGSLFEASAGVFKKVRWERSEGLTLDVAQPLTLSAIADGWERLTDFSRSEHPQDMRDSLSRMYTQQLRSHSQQGSVN